MARPVLVHFEKHKHWPRSIYSRYWVNF